MMKAGKKLPASTLKLPLALGDGGTGTLGSHAGRWVVLYFYPKDSTPGCTTEARDFQTLLPKFEKLGADVIGVSRDSAKSHVNFSSKQKLTFPLVSDADEALCRAFDVIQMKKLYGREFEGIVRSTFLIDPQSRVAQVWQPVKVPGHAQAVLDALTQEIKTA